MAVKHIMIIAHFCDYGDEKTNNRFNYLASFLAKKSFKVELVTSSFSHRRKIQRQEQAFLGLDYNIKLIYEPSYENNVSVKRMLYSHRVMANNLREYLQKCNLPDLVYCAVPSLDVAMVAANYCKENNIKFVIDVQDIWPEAFEMIFPVPFVRELLFIPFRNMANTIYKSADLIFGVSENYVQRALSVNKHCCNNSVYIGTDLAQFDSNVLNNSKYVIPKKELWLGYCGTLGKSYDIIHVINALLWLKKKENCVPKFIIMGDGPHKTKFETYAREKNVDAVFTGNLPYPQMCAWLKSCDIVINPIKSNSAASIINKHADYAAAGKPVINTQESLEYRNLVDKYKMGINCKNGDIIDLAASIKKLISDKDLRLKMGANARICAEDLFNRENTYGIIADRINDLLGKGD